MAVWFNYTDDCFMGFVSPIARHVGACIGELLGGNLIVLERYFLNSLHGAGFEFEKDSNVSFLSLDGQWRVLGI